MIQNARLRENNDRHPAQKGTLMKHTSVYLALVAVLTLVFAPSALADCRRISFVHHKPAAVVVEKKVAAVVELVTPVLPIYYGPALYGASYNAPLHSGHQGANNTEAPAWAKEMVEGYKVLKDSVLSLDQRLRRLEGTPAPPLRPMPGAANDPAPQAGSGLVRLMTERCASCHDRSVAQTKGKGLILTDGMNLAQINAEQAGLVIQEVVEGRMPKGKPFTDTEKIQFLRLLSSGK